MRCQFGKKVKTDFKTIVDTNRIFSDSESNVIVSVTYKEFRQFVKKVEQRHKYFLKKKKVLRHFNHLSPDVSFLVSKR
jgi:hypothetical protein